LFIARFGKTKTKTPAAAGGGGGGVGPYGVKRTDFKMDRELDCGVESWPSDELVNNLVQSASEEDRLTLKSKP
jgi:hypothetical protein